MIITVGLQSITLSRPSADVTVDSNGMFVQAPRTSVSFLGVVNPIFGEEAEAASAGLEVIATHKLITETEIISANEFKGIDADRIIYDGDTYLICRVRHYKEVIPHYEALLIRVENE